MMTKAKKCTWGIVFRNGLDGQCCKSALNPVVTEIMSSVNKYFSLKFLAPENLKFSENGHISLNFAFSARVERVIVGSSD